MRDELCSRALHLGLRYRPFGVGKWPAALPAPMVREVFARAEASYEPGALAQTRATLVLATRGKGVDRH